MLATPREIIPQKLAEIKQNLALRSKDKIFFRILFSIYCVFADLGNGYLIMCAKSLVFTTLLSLVPFLAVSFSFLKAFGVHNLVKPFLDEVLLPLGEKGSEIANNIVGFIDNVNVGVLGAVGITVLLFTVVSMISTVESTLNSIWQIKKPRPILQRISYYLSVIIVAPVLLFSGIGLMASLFNADLVQSIITIEPFGSLFYLLVLLVPYILLSLAFMLVYIFLPNTKVNVIAALIGAIVGGVMWRVSGDLFATFMTNFSNYDAIYSSFAALILFLIWLFVSWLIFLLGSKVAFFFQHPAYETHLGHLYDHSYDYSLRLQMSIVYLVSEHFDNDDKKWSISELSDKLNVPEQDVRDVVDALSSEGYLIAVDDIDAVLPLRSLRNIKIVELIKVAKALTGLSGGAFSEDLPSVSVLIKRIESALGSTFENETVSDWISEDYS